jgi:hypothetical protein
MRFAAVLFLIIYPALSFGQRFGGTPPSVKWQQINTDTARIIFPAGLDSQAQRVASLVHYMASHKTVALGEKLYKINIVLQNQTTIANGYVGLGPYRSEFFLNPVPNNFEEGTLSWTDQLAVHEYRHVQQYNNFRVGLSQVMYTLFGQEGYALATNAAIPDWFFEGDAVYNETILSEQGRGRLPGFLNAYPVLWMAKKNYSWMKLRNGSLKDYVPNHYFLGYLMVNYGRQKYGLDFWSKVTHDAAAFKGLIYPFQNAIKKNAGVDYKTFRNAAFDYYKNILPDSLLKDEWLVSEFPATVAGSAVLITKPDRKVVTNYEFPYNASADAKVYLKNSYNKRPAFYINSGDAEKKIRTTDITIDDQFSYRNGKIVYSAYESDPRWSWRDYSVIKLLDVNTNKQRTITRRTKYFTPDISPSGKKIAAVQIATNGKSELHILDAETGNVAMQLRSADISLFTDPKFIDDTSLVCAVRLRDGKAALALGDLGSGALERLTSPSFNVVGYPSVDNGVVYFTASYGGNDDIFAVRLKDKKIFRITQGPLGNYYVNSAFGKITWSVPSAEGYQLVEIPQQNVQWMPVNDTSVNNIAPRFAVSYEKEVNDILLQPGVNRSFSVSKYGKGHGLLNFHSWRPYYEDPEFSFSLYGENILNTTQTEVYYLYNENEKTHAVGFNFVYGGWFPYLSLGTQYTFDHQRKVGTRFKQWDQLDSRIGLSIPLAWSRDKTFKQLDFGTDYVYRKDFNKGPDKDIFTQVSFSYLHEFVSWSQQVQMARQHIYPHLGYALSLHYRHAITDYKSWQPLASAAIYLPGIAPTHSLVLTGAYQETDTTYALFPDRFSYSRGYVGGYYARMWRVSGNYHFPIFYPDWGFANILYLQRLRGNIFYDFTRIYTKTKDPLSDQRSVGVEMYIDTKWWNQYPLTFGFRISHLLDADEYDGSKGTIFEFVLPVSIFPR